MGPITVRSVPARALLFQAGWFALACAQLVIVVLRPPLPDTNQAVLGVLAVASGALALLGLAAALFARLVPVLVALIALAMVDLWIVAYVAAGGQGQLMASLYLLLLGLNSAIFLSPRMLHVLLGVGVVGYLVAITLDLHLDSPAYAVFAVALVVVVSLVTSGLVRSLQAQALRDQLTGALNRHGLETAAPAAHALAARGSRPTAVIEIDLDGFKAYNDTWGHAAGDERLATVVRDWASVLRDSDLLARLGGDEFIIVLPGTAPDEAELLLARLRGVNDVPWSAGMSTWEADEGLGEVLRRADEAMYARKRQRR